MAQEDQQIRQYSHQLERSSWMLVLFAMLSQCSDYSFPSYNVALGFWGAYCAFGKHGRATFGLIMFSFLGIILDIVYCATHRTADSSIFQFCLTMLVFSLLTKVYILYCASHFFAAIGGAYSMESSMLSTGGSMYESVVGASLEESQTGGYFPLQSNMNKSSDSFTPVEDSRSGEYG